MREENSPIIFRGLKRQNTCFFDNEYALLFDSDDVELSGEVFFCGVMEFGEF